jgi:probable rRNA maturation factor
MGGEQVAIEVINRQRLVPIDRDRIADLARAALQALGRADSSITIAFVRDRLIRQLNRTYRGKDCATDVLSFPNGDSSYLGDVVIATDTAIRQAAESGLSLERELEELTLHGILHLCGYDHETDRGQMNRLELKLRRSLLRKNRASGAVLERVRHVVAASAD